MINKTLSWTLRELAKIEKEPVIEFRVLREQKNKIEIGTKN